MPIPTETRKRACLQPQMRIRTAIESNADLAVAGGLFLEPSQFSHDGFVLDHLLLNQGRCSLRPNESRLEAVLVHLLLDLRVQYFSELQGASEG
jgi:hypothetical protein